MASALDYYSYDGDSVAGITPHRPSLDQLGGDKWINDPKYPPDPETMPYAEAMIQNNQVVSGLCRINGVAKISVSFAAGTPSVAYFKAMGTLVAIANLTVTDNAAGDTSVTWPAGTFPVREMNPDSLTINEDVAITEMRALPIANGVRVITKAGGVATDAGWTVTVYGQ